MNKMISRFLLITIAVLAVLASASPSSLAYTDEEISDAIAELNSKIMALQEKQGKSTDVNGRAYIYFQQDQMGSIKPKFEVSRVYLDLRKKLSGNVAVRVTTDIERFDPLTSCTFISTTEGNSTKADNRHIVYLKYAYFDLAGLKVPFIGLDTLRVGMSATHWIDYAQKFWKFRYVQKTLTDYFKVFTSSDLGIAALGAVDLSGTNIPGFGAFNYHATYFNGSGYKAAETNYEKHAGLNVNTVPLSLGSDAKLTVAAGGHINDLGKPATNPTTALTGLIAWESKLPAPYIVFGEYVAGYNMSGKDTSGFSLGGQYEVMPSVNVFGRYDVYDGNIKVDKDHNTLMIGGVEYKWSSDLTMALNYQNERQNGGEKDKSKAIFISSEVRW